MQLSQPNLSIIAVALLLLALNFLAMLVAAPEAQGTKLVVSLLTVLFALLTVSALFRMRHFLSKLNPDWASHWTLIIAGFSLWLLAEAVWGYYSVAGAMPYATLADIFWLLGYVLMIAGFWKANQDMHLSLKLRDTLLATAFAIFALAVAAFVLLPLLSSPADPLQKFFNLAYPIGDAVIIFLTMRLAIAFITSPLGIAWSVFLLGFIIVALSDVWYAYLLLTGTYFVGHPSDFIYNSGYIFTMAGALLFESMSRAGFRPVKEPEPAERAASQLEGLLFQKKADEAISITTQVNEADADLAVLKLLTGMDKMGCVFLCLDRPHTYFLGEFGEHGINPEMVHFVTVRERAQGDHPEVSYINSPEDLTSIKIQLDQAAKRMKEKHRRVFVLIDCIPTLSLYSDLNRLGKFLHDINLSLRDKGVYQVILLPPGGAINTYVLRFCDTNLSLA